MQLKLADIRKVAMEHPGMMDDFLAVGIPAGAYLEISREHFEAIQDKHFHGVKLGTVLHEVLKPVVTVADKLLGTQLAGCGGCAGRELKLNSIANR